MSENAQEPELSGLRLNLRIVSVVIFNFATFLTIGLPLAVLPGYVHDVMGFSAFWAGLIISLQYLATLISRPWAGRFADLFGPKRGVVIGLVCCLISGFSYLLASWWLAFPLLSLGLLALGRLALGIGQSLGGTGSTIWGVGIVGAPHIGRVISWNGVVTYGAMALGAPLGALIYAHGGLAWMSLAIMAIALAGLLLALPRRDVAGKRGATLPFRAVLGRVWPFGLALALSTSGFGVIATFITLLYEARGWSGAAFALTLFSAAFVGGRLLFPNAINRSGGLKVALVCFAVEEVGLMLVGFATLPWLVKAGTLLAGAGFSLVFPALGVEAVKAVPASNQGSALATYTVFMDLAMGITGPLAGIIIAAAGVPIIYPGAALLVCGAMGLCFWLRRRSPRAVGSA
ncbi:MFS transporter [Salmonella enterica subsp. enterica serovar Choleraesuis]|nr:MFS transporter [Salmonella enterica subsp. enterica serovar Choleraesuis]